MAGDDFRMFEQLGAGDLLRQTEYREAYAIIGEKGAEPGSATEDYGRQDPSTAVATASDDKCTGGRYIPRPTRRLNRTLFGGPMGESVSRELGRKASAATTADLLHTQQQAMQHLGAFVEAQSAGVCTGNFANIFVNGRRVLPTDSATHPRGRGIHVLTLDKDTLQEGTYNVFDVYAKAEDRQPLIDLVAGVPDGTPVIVAAADSIASSSGVDAGVLAALQSCGAKLVSTIRFRESYVMLGRKGAPAGTAIEDGGTSDTPIAPWDSPGQQSCFQESWPRPTAKLSTLFASSMMKEALAP